MNVTFDEELELNVASEVADLNYVALSERIKKLEELLANQQSKPTENNSNGDTVLVYRRTQYFDFIDPNTHSFAWSGQQIKYEFDLPDEYVGKFCEVFINGEVDARVSSMPKRLTLYSQNPTDKDEILIIAYADSEHVTNTLYAHGL